MKNNYSDFISLNSNVKKGYHDTDEKKSNIRHNNGGNNDSDSIVYDYYHSSVNNKIAPKYTDQLYKSDLGSNTSISNSRLERTENDWIQWAKAGAREPLSSPNSRTKNVLWRGDESDLGSRFQQKKWEFDSDSVFRSRS